MIVEGRRLMPPRSQFAAGGAICLLTIAGMFVALEYAEPAPTFHEGLAAATGPVRFVVLTFGALVYGNDVRHRTVGRWLPIASGRTQFILIKLATAGAIGLACGIIAVISASAVGLATRTGGSTATEIATSTGRILVALAIAGVLACALCALANALVPTLVVLLVILPLVESAMLAASPELAQWLPNSLAGNLMTQATGAPPPADQVAALGLWTTILMVMSIYFFARRDIAGSRS